MNTSPQTHCLICGYDVGEDINSGTCHIVCPCCSSRVGYTYHANETDIEHVKLVRNTWVSNGYPWNRPELKPEKWSLVEQLRNIPAIYR